jgi:cell division protein FtsB
MTDTDQLAFSNEVLHRRVAALEADNRELEAENSGLRATVARLREQTFSLAAQVTGGIP